MGLPLVGAYLRGIPFGGPKQLGASPSLQSMDDGLEVGGVIAM